MTSKKDRSGDVWNYPEFEKAFVFTADAALSPEYDGAAQRLVVIMDVVKGKHSNFANGASRRV